MTGKKRVEIDDFETIEVEGKISESELKNIKARKLMNGKSEKVIRPVREKVTAESLKEEFLEGALDAVRDVLAQARGEDYNIHADVATRNEVFKSVLPILYQANVSLDLDNLAELDPEERANRILAAVAKGKMTSKAAMELVNVMKGLADLNGTMGGDNDTSRLVINLAHIPDSTLSGQVAEEKVAIKGVLR